MFLGAILYVAVSLWAAPCIAVYFWPSCMLFFWAPHMLLFLFWPPHMLLFVFGPPHMLLFLFWCHSVCSCDKYYRFTFRMNCSGCAFQVKLANGCDVIVTTPDFLLHTINNRATDLSRLCHLVRTRVPHSVRSAVKFTRESARNLVLNFSGAVESPLKRKRSSGVRESI